MPALAAALWRACGDNRRATSAANALCGVHAPPISGCLARVAVGGCECGRSIRAPGGVLFQEAKVGGDGCTG